MYVQRLVLFDRGLAQAEQSVYITANGNVVPCCISPFSTTNCAGLILGNVFQTLFAQIWNGARYVERRAALYTTQPLHPCEQCGMY